MLKRITIAIIFIFFLIIVCNDVFNAVKNFYSNSIEEAQEELEIKYNVDFIYEKSINDEKGKKQYIFHPVDNNKIQVVAYHTVSYDSGVANILLPIFVDRVFVDNFIKQINNYCRNESLGYEYPINLNEENLMELSNKIYDSIQNIYLEYDKYSIDGDYYKPYVYVEFLINGEKEGMDFFSSEEVSDIYNQLFEHLNE